MGHKDIITSLLALVLMIIIACDTSIDSKEDTFIVFPECEPIIFDDYLLSETILCPVIRILAFEEYCLISEYAAATIDQLKAITVEKVIPGDLTELPYLPEPMEMQLFYANLVF